MLAVKFGIIILVGIISVKVFIETGGAEEELAFHQGSSQAGAEALLAIIADTQFQKNLRMVGRLPRNDIDYPAHRVSAIQGTLRSPEHFYTFHVKELGDIGIQGELVYAIHIGSDRRVIGGRSYAPDGRYIPLVS